MPKTTPTIETKPKADRGMASIPAAERRVAFLKMLKKLGATSAAAARSKTEIAAKLGYGEYDVYCLGYHKYPLAVNGLVKSATHEEGGLAFYITVKGLASLDKPAKEAKAPKA